MIMPHVHVLVKGNHVQCMLVYQCQDAGSVYVPRLIFDNVLLIFVDGQVPKGVRRQKKTLHH